MLAPERPNSRVWLKGQASSRRFPHLKGSYPEDCIASQKRNSILIMNIVHIILCFVQFFVASGLIFIVSIQEAKNDGLSGQIGTTAASSFKGMAGREEQLNIATRNLSIVFFCLSLLVAYSTKHWAGVGH